MFCARCGSPSPADGKFCARCGSPLQTEAPSLSSAPTATGGVVPPPLVPTGFVQPPETSGKAVASLLCGFLFFALPAAIAAIILGHLSLSDIRKSGGKVGGHGIAVGGLVLGYLGVCMIPVLLIIAAIAIPPLLRARTSENEASAIGSLRTIDSAALSYSASYGNGYPRDLDALSGLGAASCDHAGLINGDLAGGFRNGYVFNYQSAAGDDFSRKDRRKAASGCSFAGADSFTITAQPVGRGATGERSFYLDQTGIIRYETGGPASANSAPLE